MSNALRRLHSIVLALLAVAALPAFCVAQALPGGKLHANREREIDIRHLRAEIEIDVAKKEISGVATIEFEPLRKISAVTLDAIQLDVTKVLLDGGPAEFNADGRSLVISAKEPIGPGRARRAEITYRARPRAGMYFQADIEHEGRSYVMTYGEGGLHANWVPLYNDVNDRLTSEMLVTVPPPYVVVSNGTLVGRSERSQGTFTYHWKQDLPHPQYLIAIYVGDFERGELAPAFGSIPLAYWVPRGRLAEGAYGFRSTTRMVEHFSQRLGYRYPWVKYDQVAIPDYPIGAMEHTGVTGHDGGVLRLEGRAPDDFGPPTLDEYTTDWTAEATISHELAHHWFGDNLTCRNLSGIWLNESFASYLMMLWAEELHGRDELLFVVDRARRHYFDHVATKHVIRPLEYAKFDSPDDIFETEHTYLKGAAVLHMLRAILGDEPYFRALAHYLKKHEFSNVESRDLKIAIEEATGRNLDWFFADWITGGGHPVLEVEWRWLADVKKIDVSVTQVQPKIQGQDTFRLPATIAIAEKSGAIRRETVEIDGDDDHFLFPCEEKPLMVSLDPEGSLVAEIRCEKKIEELVFQARHDALIGRLRALAQLAERFPTRGETLDVFREILSDAAAFWGLRAEAALLLGTIRTPASEALAKSALAAPDYRMRKAAVLGLEKFGTESALALLRAVVEKDPHDDVVAAAILASAKADPALASAFLREQLGRGAWYDEIRLASLKAIAELERAALLPEVRPRANLPHNTAVRQAALEAWIAIDPTDAALHAALFDAARSAPYPLQKFSIEKLGAVCVKDAVPFLEELLRQDVDANLTKRAKKALEEIRRVRGGS